MAGAGRQATKGRKGEAALPIAGVFSRESEKQEQAAENKSVCRRFCKEQLFPEIFCVYFPIIGQHYTYKGKYAVEHGDKERTIQNEKDQICQGKGGS